MDLEGNILQAVLEEVEAAEERDVVRLSHRHLRDSSDPFSLPAKNFLGIFRLSKELAKDLIDEMTPYYPEPERSTGIPIIIRVLVSLQLLGQGSYQKCVGQDYNLGVSQASVSRCLTMFCNILVEHFINNWIKFPAQEADRIPIKAEFMRKYSFPGVIGCIDCSHIAIVPPPVEDVHCPAIEFYNRKGFHSLNTQVICDANLKIMAVNARYPGSVHDAAIWRQSGIRQLLQQQYNAGNRSFWLLGDSGYGLEPWLMTPISNAEQGTPEFRYTQAHCSARNCIERTFGLLKSVFRCLLKDRVLHYAPMKAANIVYSCCILHNMRLQRRLEFIEEEEEDVIADDPAGPTTEPVHEDDALLNTARRIRNNIIRNHFS